MACGACTVLVVENLSVDQKQFSGGMIDSDIEEADEAEHLRLNL